MATANNRLRYPILTHRKTRETLFEATGRRHARAMVHRPGRRLGIAMVEAHAEEATKPRGRPRGHCPKCRCPRMVRKSGTVERCAECGHRLDYRPRPNPIARSPKQQ